jgi:hypothetical protein
MASSLPYRRIAALVFGSDYPRLPVRRQGCELPRSTTIGDAEMHRR